MYFIDSGDLESLLSWWYRPDYYNFSSYNFEPEIKPDYLCFIVAGNLQFEETFKKILESLHTFDLITGKHIGVFLYGEKVEFYLKSSKNATSHSLGIHLVDRDNLPNKQNSKLKYYTVTDRFRRNKTDEHFKYYNIDQIDLVNAKNNLFESSFFFSKKIIEHFELSPGEYPSILLLSRDKAKKPLILPLKQEKGIKIIFDFFEDLAKVKKSTLDFEKYIIDSEKVVYSIPRYENGIKTIESTINKNSDKILELKNEYIEHLKLLNSYLLGIGIPDNIINQGLLGSVDETEELYKKIGINTKFEPLIEFLPYREKIIKLYTHNEVKQIFKLLKANTKQRKKILHNSYLNALQKNKLLQLLNNSKNQLVKIKLESTQFENTKDLLDYNIEELVAKYNTKFLVRDKYWKVKDFVQEVVSWIKNIQEIKDITKLIKDMK